MGKAKKHSPDQIVNILRQIEVASANGKTHPVACREVGITEQTFYRWRKEYGGLKADQAIAAPVAKVEFRTVSDQAWFGPECRFRLDGRPC